jgi:hypothetical protein
MKTCDQLQTMALTYAEICQGNPLGGAGQLYKLLV